jgi:hypothetical protein
MTVGPCSRKEPGVNITKREGMAHGRLLLFFIEGTFFTNHQDI